MKKQLFSFLIITLLISCTHLTPTEKELHNTLNKTLKLDMFETVIQGNNLLSFEDIRQQHKNISVVYLENGCRPCYPKFIEWQNRVDSLSEVDNHTVLFVIKGHSYDEFMRSVFDVNTLMN